MGGIKTLIAINIVLMTVLSALYFFKPPTPTPRVSSKIDQSSNRIFVQKNDSIDFYELLRAELGEDAPKFAVYFMRPKLDKVPVIFQSRPMRPASMIKVFVMAKAMFDAKHGMLSLDEPLTITSENVVGGAGSIAGEGIGAKVSVRQAIEHMIVESDNTATNLLIDRLGMENLNRYLRDNGYQDTIFNHKMMLEKDKTNLSSARDLGLLFTRIYRRECVDDFYDWMMVNYLLRQEDTDCFPAALPYWNIAHKTGEVIGLYDDGGIFYGASGDFVLVIMNDDIDGREETIERMKAITIKAALTLDRSNEDGQKNFR